MVLDRVRTLLGLHGAAAEAQAGDLAQAQAPSSAPDAQPDDDDPVWPSARVGLAESLWGEGFLFPGGGSEVARLAAPLGLSEASSLLLIGAGSGGPPRRIAAEFGVWVSGYEANRHLVDLANTRSQRAGLGRRAQVEHWDPANPKFPRRFFHHGITIDALRDAGAPALLGAVARALKPAGQLVLLETVADLPLDSCDAAVASWSRLDHRAAPRPSELEVTRLLARLGFDVRIVEDYTARHMHDVMTGWATLVRAMADAPPGPRQAAVMVGEAELWLAQLRLMRQGRLRLVRWHAMGG